MWFRNAREADKSHWNNCSNYCGSKYVFICVYSHSLAGILDSVIISFYFREVDIAEDEEIDYFSLNSNEILFKFL